MPRRASISLFLLAFVAAIAVGTHGIAYWDAGDYVVLAIRGGPSGLLLGRPLFLAISSIIARLALKVHAPVEPLLRYAWTAASATAAPLLAILVHRLRANVAIGIVAGMALALSPSFAHTAHQVLTDGPALALSIAALIVAIDGRAIAAGALMACAIATRETAVVHLVAVVLVLPRRRAPIAAMVCVVLLFGIVLASHGGTFASLRSWVSAMHRSSSAHPLGLREVAISIGWLLSLGPIAVIAALLALARDRTLLRSTSGRVIVPAAIATAALLFYPDGSFSPRYLLATAPVALLPAAATLLAGRPRVALCVLALPLLFVPVVTRKARAIAERGAQLEARLAQLPNGVLLVPGHFCPHARVHLATHAERRLDLVCPGWDWPRDLAAALDGARAAGRTIALDLADDAWVGARENTPRDEARAWAARHTGRDVAGFVLIEP